MWHSESCYCLGCLNKENLLYLLTFLLVLFSFKVLCCHSFLFHLFLSLFPSLRSVLLMINSSFRLCDTAWYFFRIEECFLLKIRLWVDSSFLSISASEKGWTLLFFLASTTPAEKLLSFCNGPIVLICHYFMMCSHGPAIMFILSDVLLQCFCKFSIIIIL